MKFRRIISYIAQKIQQHRYSKKRKSFNYSSFCKGLSSTFPEYQFSHYDIDMFLNDEHPLKITVLKVVAQSNTKNRVLPEQFWNILSKKMPFLEGIDLDGISYTQLPSNSTNFSSLYYLLLQNGNKHNLPLPKGIHEFKNLHYLIIHSYNLSSLPFKFSSLKQLRSLNMTNNSLINVPSSLNELVYLRELHLAHNQLQKFVDLPNVQKIQILDLSFNHFTEFPQELMSIRSRFHLAINNNRIRHLPAFFPILTLTSMEWRENPFLQPYQDILEMLSTFHLSLAQYNSRADFQIFSGLSHLQNEWRFRLQTNHVERVIQIMKNDNFVDALDKLLCLQPSVAPTIIHQCGIIQTASAQDVYEFVQKYFGKISIGQFDIYL